MFNFKKKEIKKVLNIKFCDGTKITVNPPDYRGGSQLVTIQKIYKNMLQGNITDSMKTLKTLYRVSAELMSNNLENVVISEEYLWNLLSNEEVFTFIGKYIDRFLKDFARKKSEKERRTGKTFKIDF